MIHLLLVCLYPYDANGLDGISTWSTDVLSLPKSSTRFFGESTDDHTLYLFAGSQGNYRWRPSEPNLVTTLAASKAISHCWSKCGNYMPDHKIYLMGQDASDYGVVELFDTETETFIDHNISIPIALRVGCSAGDYDNGFIYYYGGQDSDYGTNGNIYTTLQRFDIYNQTWTSLQSNSAATTAYIRTSCIYTDAYFWTFGGSTTFADSNPINTIYRYDIGDDSWAKVSATLPFYAQELVSIYNPFDAKVYLLGAQGVVQFDPVSINTVPQPDYSGYNQIAVNIVGDKIRVWGGNVGDVSALTSVKIANISGSSISFDHDYTSTGSITTPWSTDSSVSLPEASGRLFGESTDDGTLYIFAGSTGNYRWRPSDPTIVTTLAASKAISHCWSKCGNYMPDHKIYLMGQDASDYGVVELFDTETETFIDHNISIPIALRVGCSAGDYDNGFIYYYGGQDSDYGTNGNIYTTLQRFDIYTQEWVQLQSNIAANVAFIRTTCICTPNGYFWAFGGSSVFAGYNPTSTIFRYDISDDSWAITTAQGSGMPIQAASLVSIYNPGDGGVYLLGEEGVVRFDPIAITSTLQYDYSGYSQIAVNIVADKIRVWGGNNNDEQLTTAVRYATITTAEPTASPTEYPTKQPTQQPTRYPTRNPSKQPTTTPTRFPTRNPSKQPTTTPTRYPTTQPSTSPSRNPTGNPTTGPSTSPSRNPTIQPSTSPSRNPTGNPTTGPSTSQSRKPTSNPIIAETTGVDQSTTTDQSATMANIAVQSCLNVFVVVLMMIFALFA
eukprot:336257_1